MPAKKPVKRAVRKTTSRSTRKPVRKTARVKTRKRRVKALDHVQIHYNRARSFLDIKIPRTSVRLAMIMFFIAAVAAIAAWPEAPRSMELIYSDSCNPAIVPEESLALYNKFGIESTTTFQSFNDTFAKLKDDIPGLTAYYGPGFGKNNPKNGVGVHFSPTSAAGFILIWEKPFFTAFEETASGMAATPGDYHSRLTTIWLFNGQNELVCEVNL